MHEHRQNCVHSKEHHYAQTESELCAQQRTMCTELRQNHVHMTFEVFHSFLTTINSRYLQWHITAYI